MIHPGSGRGSGGGGVVWAGMQCGTSGCVCVCVGFSKRFGCSCVTFQVAAEMGIGVGGGAAVYYLREGVTSL